MKTSRFSDGQILAILKQTSNGVLVTDLCREHGMNGGATCYRRARDGGMEAEEDIPPRYAALKKRLQSLVNRFVASYPRVLPFLTYPQVFQANQRVITHLTNIGAEW